MQVKSPITNSNNVLFEKEIKSDDIIENYKKSFNIDVAKFFKQVEIVKIYKCLDTGYRFYYPLNIEGDSRFYEALQNYPWYYMDWKWEHEVASSFIDCGDKILEIGCGRGGFLKRMQQKQVKCVGLELNKSVGEVGRKFGINILRQSMQDYAKKNLGRYDAVCSFQVVEHIAAIRGFIQASIDALKSGGKFIISVPNNFQDSPILKNSVLNMPPHHLGLWDITSLISLQEIFNIRLERLEIEPVQKYHFGHYDYYAKNQWIDKYGLPGKLISKISRPLTQNIIKNLSNCIMGHTILAQYKKI